MQAIKTIAKAQISHSEATTGWKHFPLQVVGASGRPTQESKQRPEKVPGATHTHPHTHTRSYTYTHMHTHLCTCISTYVHKCTCAYTYMYTYTCTLAHVCICTCTCTHAYTYTHVCTCTYIHMYTRVPAQMSVQIHTCMCVRAHIYICTHVTAHVSYTHACTNTHTYLHTCRGEVKQKGQRCPVSSPKHTCTGPSVAPHGMPFFTLVQNSLSCASASHAHSGRATGTADSGPRQGCGETSAQDGSQAQPRGTSRPAVGPQVTRTPQTDFHTCSRASQTTLLGKLLRAV